MAKKALKVPKKVKYADGGPVTEFSWDDYYKRLGDWQNANAQDVPRDIVDYQSKWIVPQIKQAQVALNAALATKYNLQPGQAPGRNQQLDRAEAEAAIGKDNYATYLTNVQGYQSYRDKVAGSYNAPKSTTGAFDASGEQYGPRHFGMFTLTPAQAVENVATTQAAGMPTTQAEADALAAQPPTVTTTETAIPQDMTPSGGVMIPPGKQAGTTAAAPAPASTEAAPAAAAAPKYEKYVTNFGQTYYYNYDQTGKKQQIQQQEYDSGIKANPNAEKYILDESTGLYDEQGQPKKPVLEVQPKVESTPPKMKKGGKVGGKKKGYVLGGVIAPDTLTPDQLIAFEKFATDEERQAYLDSVTPRTDAAAGLTGKQKAIASLAAPVSQLGAAGINSIEVDPLNKRGIVAQDAGAGALKGAGTGLTLGMNPFLMGVTGGLSAPIGAAAGAIVGGLYGAKKGKKEYGANKSAADDVNRQNAMAASFTDSGYADGGTIKDASKDAKKVVPVVPYVEPRGMAINEQGIPSRKKVKAYADGGKVADKYVTAVTGSMGVGKLTQKAAERLPSSNPKIMLYAEGGEITGAGTAKSDDIAASVKKGSFIVPAENAKMAEMLRKQYLPKATGKAKLNQGGNTDDVYLSNGEHMFTPDEVKVLVANGIDVDGLAPNSEESGYGYADGGTVKPSKAKQILKDGKIKGKDLTSKQKRYFGWIAGKGMKDGGGVGDPPKDANQRLSEINARLDQLDLAEKGEIERTAIGERVDDKEWNKQIQEERAALKSEQESLRATYGVAMGYDKPTPLPSDYSPTKPIYTYTKPSEGGGTGAAKSGAKPAAAVPKTAAAPKSGVSSGGNGGAAAAKETVATPETKAMQDAFIKEHGGIAGSGEAPVVAADAIEKPNAVGVVAPHPADELIKKYDELTKAGKIGEANDLEAQINAIDGGAARLTSFKTKPATDRTGAPASFIPTSEADTAETADAAGSTADIPPSPIKRAYEAIGPAGVLAIGQGLLGAAQTMKNKAPVPEVDPVLLQRRNDALQKASMGLSPAEYGNAANRIESNRANAMRAITGSAGGDLGAIVGNSRLASIDANRSRLDLESANNRMKQQNEARADNLVAAVAQQRHQIFAQNMNMFNQQQAASAGLMNAGLENLFGSISSRENQNRIDERANKYGTVNFTFPGTT